MNNVIDISEARQKRRFPDHLRLVHSREEVMPLRSAENCGLDKPLPRSTFREARAAYPANLCNFCWVKLMADARRIVDPPCDTEPPSAA